MPRRYTFAAASLMTLTLFACSGDSGPEPGRETAAPSSASDAPATAPAAPAVADGRKVEITADDTMKFSTVEISAKAGERLSITLANRGQAPKFSMGHNWVLLALGTDWNVFVAAAGESPTTDYVPADKKSEILAATKLLGPGESDTVTFSAPTAPGRYVFLCSFPGHAQVGMRGVLIVN